MPKSIIYTQAFKSAVLAQLKKGHTVAEVAKAFGLHTAAIYRWKQEAEQANKKSNKDRAAEQPHILEPCKGENT